MINSDAVVEGYVLKKELSAPVLDHMMRVINEFEQLTTKINALAGFISNTTGLFGSLPEAERDRLNRQYDAMMVYVKILIERIDAFE